MNYRIEDLLAKFAELEKHTVWRIKDCEELLKTRVNEQYVDDAVRKVEGRVTYEVNTAIELLMMYS
jgi:hypothetical protein